MWLHSHWLPAWVTVCCQVPEPGSIVQVDALVDAQLGDVHFQQQCHGLGQTAQGQVRSAVEDRDSVSDRGRKRQPQTTSCGHGPELRT